MFRKILITYLVLVSSTQFALAFDYRITTDGVQGQPQDKAVLEFERRLRAEDTDASLDYLPGIAKRSELLDLLSNDVVDIAVVPFEAIPALSRSPLLKPFYAKTATEVRKTIDSEVGAFEKIHLERDGFRVLDFWHVSSTIYGSKSPVTSAGDLQGQKLYDAAGLGDETMQALGVSPTPMAFGEVFNALQLGAIDSSAVPLDERGPTLGFTGVLQNYVDRVYRPALYAVLISEKDWRQIPFSDQHYLAKTAVAVGQALVGGLEAQAKRFQKEESALGSAFNAWSADDVAQVRLASLKTSTPNDQQLVDLTYSVASASSTLAPDSDPKPASRVSILFATDRKAADLSKPETAFSSLRELNGHTFGRADIDLRAGRKLGDSLGQVSRIMSIEEVNPIDFLEYIKNKKKDIIVFVHGYNNSFTDSIRRGATIQEDIAGDAILISYTWPSDGELLSYGYDESSTDTADQNFKLFLNMLTTEIGSARISVVAHSMGSRLLTKYLAGLGERAVQPSEVKFKNIVFAAADISTQFFKQKEENPPNPALPLSAYAERITLYSSKYDRALGLSQKLHRDKRLGLADQASIYLEADIVSIDASQIDPASGYLRFSFATRHSYVFDKSVGVQDLTLLLAGFDPAVRPGMTKKSRNGLTYWVLTP